MKKIMEISEEKPINLTAEVITRIDFMIPIRITIRGKTYKGYAKSYIDGESITRKR